MTVTDPEARLLIVEDEPNIRELLATSLQFAGFEVHTAGDGHAAIAAAATHDPDLVVLDVMLPDMDGFEVTRKLRESGRRAPCRFLLLCGPVPGEGHVMISAPHAIVDGRSLMRLLSDLLSSWVAAAAGEAEAVESLPITPAAYGLVRRPLVYKLAEPLLRRIWLSMLRGYQAAPPLAPRVPTAQAEDIATLTTFQTLNIICHKFLQFSIFRHFFGFLAVRAERDEIVNIIGVGGREFDFYGRKAADNPQPRTRSRSIAAGQAGDAADWECHTRRCRNGSFSRLILEW